MMKRTKVCLVTLSTAGLLVFLFAGPPGLLAQEVKKDTTVERQSGDLNNQKVSPDKQKQDTDLKRETAGAEQTFTSLIAAFSAFGALILILSIFPEKLTDFFKAVLKIDKKDTLSELYGWKTYDSVFQANQATLQTAYEIFHKVVEENSAKFRKGKKIADQMRSDLPEPEGKPDPSDKTKVTPLTVGELQQSLILLDLRMDEWEGRRVNWLRSWSMFFGIAIAGVFKINAFFLLAPMIPADEMKEMLAGNLGIFLTGLGAGMGAPFWQDFLDALTSAKAKVAKLGK
jgi:hypothetical protein